MFGILALFLQNTAGHLLYLALHLETGSFPRPLSAAKEQEAFAAYRAGDTAARELLIAHNLRLVAHVAKKYYTANDGQDDLVSIGTIGLIKAVDSFNPDRPTRFSSYASQCIENEIRMELRRRRREAGTVSLQEPLEGSGDGLLTLADTLADEGSMETDCERKDLRQRVRVLMEELPEADRKLLAMRYGWDGTPPMTQQETAKKLGISRSYVSRLEKKILDELREKLNV